MWIQGLAYLYRHPREGGGPVPLQAALWLTSLRHKPWIPAFAGMTAEPHMLWPIAY